MVNRKIIGAAVTLFAAASVLQGPGFASAARILGVFPHFGYSHHMVFLPYLRGLADRGHDMHVISNFASSHPRITDIDIRGTMPMHNENKTITSSSSTLRLATTVSTVLSLYALAKSTEGMFGAPAVQRLLSDENAAFDLVVAEHFNSEVPLGFAAKYRVPFVLLSSCPLMPWTVPLIGQSHHAAYRPSVLAGYSERMSLGQRLVNVLSAYVSVAFFHTLHRPWSQNAVKRHLDVDVSLGEFASNASMVFVNTHWTVHGVAPALPSVVEIGGIHVEPTKRLPTVSI